jgi:cation:H+ antiporter
MIIATGGWPLWVIAALMAGAALVIAVAGAVFVGGSTSLPGLITSVVTAAGGYPGLAIGNAVGGLTAQTAFLAIADLAHRGANLEHAAASVTGLTQGTLLVSLLTLPLLAAAMPRSRSWASIRSRCCCSSATVSASAC